MKLPNQNLWENKRKLNEYGVSSRWEASWRKKWGNRTKEETKNEHKFGKLNTDIESKQNVRRKQRMWWKTSENVQEQNTRKILTTKLKEKHGQRPRKRGKNKKNEFNGLDWSLLMKHLEFEDIHNSWSYCFTASIVTNVMLSIRVKLAEI